MAPKPPTAPRNAPSGSRAPSGPRDEPQRLRNALPGQRDAPTGPRDASSAERAPSGSHYDRSGPRNVPTGPRNTPSGWRDPSGPRYAPPGPRHASAYALNAPLNAPTGPRHAPAPSSTASSTRRELPRFKKLPPTPTTQASTSSGGPSSVPPAAPAPKRTPPPDFTGAVEWSNGSALLAYNTTYRPPDIQPGLARAGRFATDGLWGWKEYTRHPQPLDPNAPFAAWIKIPSDEELASDLLYRRARRQDLAMDPEPLVKGQEGKRAMGWRNGMCRVTDEMYGILKDRHTAIRAECERATRLLGRAASTKMGKVDGKSVVRVMVNHLRPPSKEYLFSARTCELLRHGRFDNFEDFDVCWTAHQRTLWMMLAWIDFVGDILPPNFAPSLTHQAALTPKSHRRGLILAGKELKTFFGFFKRLGIPLWAWINRDEFEIPPSKFGPAGPSRVATRDCERLNTYVRIILPGQCYPPGPVVLALLEPVGRGYLPRPDDADSFKLSDQALSKKRRSEGEEKNMKRQQLAKEKALERAQSQFGDLGLSLGRYQELTARSPAARRYYISKLSPRPTWAPLILPEYASAENEAGAYLNLLAPPVDFPLDKSAPDFYEKYKNGKDLPRALLAETAYEEMEKRALLTYLPPLSVFTGTGQWKKTISFVVHAVRLLPHLLERVETARTDPRVRPLGTGDWKGMLSINYWRDHWMDMQRVAHALAKVGKRRKEVEAEGLEEGEEFNEEAEIAKAMKDKITFEPYDHDVFWKYGSYPLFGLEKSQDLCEPGAQLELGKLACGCPPTDELLRNDPALVCNILTYFEALRAMHWFAELTSDRLAFEGVPSAKDADTDHHMPDFFNDDADRQRETVWLIERLMLNNMSIGKDGWPIETDYDESGNWIKNFAVLLSRANDADAVDRYMKFDDHWLKKAELGQLYTGGWNDGEKGSVDTQLMLRYVLTSFAAKQWPVPLNYMSSVKPANLKCSHCRAKDRAQQQADTGMAALFQEEEDVEHFYDDYDLSDDESEREGFSE